MCEALANAPACGPATLDPTGSSQTAVNSLVSPLRLGRNCEAARVRPALAWVSTATDGVAVATPVSLRAAWRGPRWSLVEFCIPMHSILEQRRTENADRLLRLGVILCEAASGRL